MAVLMAAVGCGKGNFSEASRAGAELVFVNPSAVSPTSLDPARIQDSPTRVLMQNVYEGLVRYGENSEIQPALAESWEIEDGGKSYVFKIRENAKFHNGQDVTAEDVKWSLERASNPKLGSPTATGYLNDIIGFAEVAAGKATELAGVEVVDRKTVRIRIDANRPYFLGKLSYNPACVLPKGVAGETEIASIEQAIGTGPFRLEKIVPDQSITFSAFEDYHSGAPAIAKMSVPIIVDGTTRLNKFRAGESDVIFLEQQDIPAILKDPEFAPKLKRSPSPGVFYLGLNQVAYKPFADVRVRKAFALAIDRQRVAETNLGLPLANNFVPPGIPGHREGMNGFPYDPEQARRLLAEAGFPNGKGLPPLEITYRDSRADSKLLAVSAATDLKKNLGVPVQSRALEWRTLLERRNAKQLPFYVGSWFADYLDPQNFLSILLMSDADQNNDGYRNETFDRLCRQADVELDPETRISLYQQAEDVLIADVARIPVYYPQDSYLVSDRFEGVRVNAFQLMDSSKVRPRP